MGVLIVHCRMRLFNIELKSFPESTMRSIMVVNPDDPETPIFRDAGPEKEPVSSPRRQKPVTPQTPANIRPKTTFYYVNEVTTRRSRRAKRMREKEASK